MIGIGVAAAAAAFIYWRIYQEDEMARFRNKKIAPVIFDSARYQSERDYVMQRCPEKGELVKEKGRWHTKDGKWVSHTESTASKVIDFIGTQWIGTANKGQIICMYSTDEVVAFTLNLEPKNALLAAEPKDLPNWSSLIEDRYRICRSSNVADCPYKAEYIRAKTQKDVMEEIKWQPRAVHDD